MNKVVLALGMCLGALSLAACEAKQEEPAVTESQAEAEAEADMPVEASESTVVEDTTGESEAAQTESTAAETMAPAEDVVEPAE